MTELLSALQGEKEFQSLISALKKEDRPVLVSGISSSLRELFPASVLSALGGRAVLVLPEESEAISFHRDLSTVFDRVLFYPARDHHLVRVDSESSDFSVQRLSVLHALHTGEFDCIVTTAAALCQTTLPPELFAKGEFAVSVGDTLPKEELLSRLIACGYTRCDRVEGKGQLATRGDLIDVFLPTEEKPVRIELFGDEVDAMGYFDPFTQRRVENTGSVRLLPAKEFPFDEGERETLCTYLAEAVEKTRPEEKEKRVFLRETAERIRTGLSFAEDLFLPLVYRFATLFDYLKDETVFLFDLTHQEEALRRAEALFLEEVRVLAEENRTLLPPEDLRWGLSSEEYFARLSEKRCVMTEHFFAGKSLLAPSGIFSFRTRTGTTGFQDMPRLKEELSTLWQEGYRTLLLCDHSMAAESLSDYFSENGIRHGKPAEGEPLPAETALLLTRSARGASLVRHGFELADSRIALLCDGGGERKLKKRRTPRTDRPAGERILSYQDLETGDYVVHRSHGIGVFQGVESMKSADGSRKDFIKISYLGSDVLYVPCSNLDAVTKYIGPKSDSDTLKLSRLGGKDWQTAKSRAKKSAKNIAKELVALYADRQKRKGYAFSPDTAWQAEFEDAFPYGETEDQLRATREIKEDMEKERPMDRLLCGDVGFGKTEVALRGVFKCVMDGKQAAILVPTTILAWQHYQTMLSRFKGYPVRIEMLSRFRSKKEQEAILKKLKEGQIDILVGTHRLLQKDVEFADLGFLVIDEEQRFGVTHKERLKEMSRDVDVLALSATPIPRTMNMALGGIKDMSLLEEAPEDRFPVQTYVLEYDRGLILEAMHRELRRGGQVLYLNNNIDELLALAPAMEREFPEAGIAVAHGKMDKEKLSDVWRAMMDKEIDVLLCTTIIETGIDLPDANTLIVENADRFGLSQLHQIRGRVGRSDRKARAYLTYRRGKVLSEVSVKRLEAIREYTRFGSGFKIALRDLEIRGAGNLLGAEQSGHLDSVGYDMYMRILQEAVLEEKGEVVPEKSDCVVDLSLDGFIPGSYVPTPGTRMELYRKIASVRTKEDVADLTDEMLDRFGDIPKTVQNLFAVSLCRAKAERILCEKITQRGHTLHFIFTRAEEGALLLLSAVYASRLSLDLVGKPTLRLTFPEKQSPVDAAEELLDHLTSFTEEVKKP